MPAGKQHKPLGRILKEMELVTEGQIQDAIKEQKKTGEPLGEILVKLGAVGRQELLLALAAQAGLEIVDLESIEIPTEVIERVPERMARAYGIMPFKMDDNTVYIATSNPHDINAIDDLKNTLKCNIKAFMATEESIRGAQERYYGQHVESMGKVLSELGSEEIDFDSLKKEKDAAYNIEEMAESAPVKNLMNQILLFAVKAQASDIHLEPFEDTFRIRYRVDGALYEMQSPPMHLAAPLVTRVKVMSNLNISESRLPQDGRILLTVGGKPVDLRVSTLPTIHGESVVMRVLDRSVVKLDIEGLGMREDDLAMMKKLIELPHGICIVTGPTGSGKTTTLYSCLNYLNDVRWKIITTEDPVEYDIDGIVQCQVNEDIKVTYAALLRTILRQDPDIILVGEIRDLETAEIAVESSLTGHLVFSTLHTNDAPSSITRLIDLGIEPYLIAATVEGIVAQRLVRRICSECKVEFRPSEEQLMELGLTPDEVKGKRFCVGKGCAKCNGTGYKGRMAIYEIMLLTEAVKNLIITNPSTEQIRVLARQQGMRTLRNSGLLAIFDGHTTMEEVARETMFAEE